MVGYTCSSQDHSGSRAPEQDERMLDLMTCMDAPALCCLAYVSRAFYVFAHVDDLWKTLVLEVRWAPPSPDVGRTYLHLHRGSAKVLHLAGVGSKRCGRERTRAITVGPTSKGLRYKARTNPGMPSPIVESFSGSVWRASRARNSRYRPGSAFRMTSDFNSSNADHHRFPT